MSDEVVTSDVDALLPSDDTGQAVTSADAPSTSGGGDVAVKRESSTAKSAKVNFQDFPEFLDYKSKFDRRNEELTRQVNQLMEAQEASRLAGMSEPQRDKYMLGKYKEQAEAATSEARAMLEEQQRTSDIAELSASYGIPKVLLEAAANLKAAETLAKEWKGQLKEAAREYTDKVARNSPETGGGGTSRSVSQSDAKYAKAIQDRDPLALIRAARET